MGKSFFYGTDEELANGSANFSALITATPTAYGLTAALASQYAALDATFQAAYTAAIEPATRTTPKVKAKNDAKKPLRLMASQLAKLVDGTASVSDEQRLELGLSVRADPTPVDVLGTPYKITGVLDGNNGLVLKWKCTNPAGATGTVYQMWRSIAGGEWQYLGGTGAKKFTDSTLPAGVGNITYKIQAVRSTAVGGWAQFNVGLGAGDTTATIQMQTTKLAA